MKRARLFEMPTGHSGKGWHQLESFIRCPKEYQFREVRKVVPVIRFLPEPLSVGLLLHAARAQWLYDGRKGNVWLEAISAYRRKLEADEPYPLSPNAEEQAKIHFQGYVDYNRMRPQTKVLAIEYPVEARVLKPGAPEFAKRTTRYDSIESWMGETWIGELKSTSDSESGLSTTYDLHGQLVLQMALWGEAEEKRFGKLAGVLIDPLLKGRGKPSRGGNRIPLRVRDYEHAIKWFRRDLQTWVGQTQMITWDATVERRPVCMRKYGPCPYVGLCKEGKGMAHEYKIQGDKNRLDRWTPSPGKEVAPWE